MSVVNIVPLSIHRGIIQGLVCSVFLILAAFSNVSATVQSLFISAWLKAQLNPNLPPQLYLCLSCCGPWTDLWALNWEFKPKSAWKEMLFCNCYSPEHSCLSCVPRKSYWRLYNSGCWESLSAKGRLLEKGQKGTLLHEGLHVSSERVTI